MLIIIISLAMKTVIYVFSGTGNTKRIADLFAMELSKRNCAVTVHDIGKDIIMPESIDADTLIIAYPVHAFNCPLPVLDFLKKLPHAKVNTYLLQTSGEALKFNNAAAIRPINILKKKDYTVKGCFHFIMPYNIIFRHSDPMAARMWRAATIKTPAYVQKIIKGEEEIINVDSLSRAISGILSIEHPGARIIGKGYKADDSCIGCGKCAKDCPQENIKMENSKPVFGSECSICMRCVMNCPANAIHPSILNGWKVNGSYSFQGRVAEDNEICRYCRRSYLKYFKGAEKITTE